MEGGVVRQEEITSIPAVVSYKEDPDDPEDPNKTLILVGQEAIDDYINNEGRTFFNISDVLGANFDNPTP